MLRVKKTNAKVIVVRSAASQTKDNRNRADAFGFVPLKLTGHWRKRTPADHVSLAQVLDAVGRHAHPVEWGRLPGWDQMPFRYDRRTDTYRGSWTLRLVAGKPDLRSETIGPELTRTQCRACGKHYRSVCERLIGAFEGKSLAAWALHSPSGEITPITAPGIWATQAIPAFYTGLVIVPDRQDAPTVARVLVRAADLDSWNRAQDLEGAEERLVAARQRVGRAVYDFMTETGLRPTKDRLRELCACVMGGEFLQRPAAFADVWEQIPVSRGGAPGLATKRAFEAQHEALLTRIKAAWTGDTAAPA